jgi:hypothetical protein
MKEKFKIGNYYKFIGDASTIQSDVIKKQYNTLFNHTIHKCIEAYKQEHGVGVVFSDFPDVILYMPENNLKNWEEKSRI